MLRNIFKTTLILAMLISNLYAMKKNEIESKMRDKIDNVLSVLKDNSLNLEEKKTKVITIVDDAFDFNLMAQIALGKEVWSSLNNKTQDDFVKIFEEKLKKSYSEKLELYNDQNVKIVSLEPYLNTRLQLKTELVGKEGNYEVNYNFYEKDSNWYIYDIELVGVSIIKTYRQQFSSVLKEKSFDEMLKQFKNQ